MKVWSEVFAEEWLQNWSGLGTGVAALMHCPLQPHQHDLCRVADNTAVTRTMEFTHRLQN